MEDVIARLICAKQYAELKDFLSNHPESANEGLSHGSGDERKAHPLHRICDGVFAGAYTESEGLEMVKIFLEAGADVNGGELREKQDSPLTAAISLYADEIALFYITHGANIFHAGCHGGTALHWAAWCGSDRMLAELISRGAKIDQLCIEFKSTPLFWAVHGLKFGGEGNRRRQAECVKILLEHGADKSIPNFEGYRPVELLKDTDADLRALLS